jgi:hypothetical protein
MYYSMPINMFFIVKNHWKPYFTDNLPYLAIFSKFLLSEILVVANELSKNGGPAVAQGVSRWFSTAAALVRGRVSSYEIFGGQSCAGECFLRVLWFPLQAFHRLLHTHHPPSSGAGTIGQ